MYGWAARRFFAAWPDPQTWAELPLERRTAADDHTRPLILWLMVHGHLRPGYNYLVVRKLASLWECQVHLAPP
jgi:hypothetical protein